MEPNAAKEVPVHLEVDTPGHPPALHVTPADQQDRAQVRQLAQDVQELTEHNVQDSDSRSLR